MEILKAINKLLNPLAPPRNYPINDPTITLFTDDYSYLLFSNFRLALWCSAETVFHWESRNNRRDLTQAPTTAHIYPPTSIHVCPFGLLSCYYAWILSAPRKPEPSNTWTVQDLSHSHHGHCFRHLLTSPLRSPFLPLYWTLPISILTGCYLFH